ncbi:hypothetical protein VTK56DRAFT_1513 [Thermocarpiscus australiensis]
MRSLFPKASGSRLPGSSLNQGGQPSSRPSQPSHNNQRGLFSLTKVDPRDQKARKQQAYGPRAEFRMSIKCTGHCPNDRTCAFADDFMINGQRLAYYDPKYEGEQKDLTLRIDMCSPAGWKAPDILGHYMKDQCYVADLPPRRGLGQWTGRGAEAAAKKPFNLPELLFELYEKKVKFETSPPLPIFRVTVLCSSKRHVHVRTCDETRCFQKGKVLLAYLDSGYHGGLREYGSGIKKLVVEADFCAHHIALGDLSKNLVGFMRSLGEKPKLFFSLNDLFRALERYSYTVHVEGREVLHDWDSSVSRLHGNLFA